MLRASSLSFSLAVSSTIRASLICHSNYRDYTRPAYLSRRITSSLASQETEEEDKDKKEQDGASSSYFLRDRAPHLKRGKRRIEEIVESPMEYVAEAMMKTDLVHRRGKSGGYWQTWNPTYRQVTNRNYLPDVYRESDAGNEQEGYLGKRGSIAYRRDRGIVRETQIQWGPLRRHLTKLDTICQLPGITYFESGKPSMWNGNGEPLMSTKIISLLQKIGFSRNIDDVWDAYVELTQLQTEHPHVQEHYPDPPFAHLHRICRLLGRSVPKTQTHFARLLHILMRLWDIGGEIHLMEWNSLMDTASKGWRTTTTEDFSRTMSVYNDMILGLRPGSGLRRDIPPYEEEQRRRLPMRPDIYTYTTLLSVAARSRDANNITLVVNLLQSSGLRPNRYTHLSLLAFYANNKQLTGVRATLIKMKQQGFDLGIDGLNSCIWGFSKARKFDVVINIYRLLRANCVPDTDEEKLWQVTRELENEEYIPVPDKVKPDGITYSAVIQAMVDHGNFSMAMMVFADMISFWTMGTIDGSSFAAFRAIFLGFSRYADIPPRQLSPTESDNTLESWSLEHLKEIFDLYLMLPSSEVPNRSMLLWILVGFDKASGRDLELLRSVWTQLDEHFQSNTYLHSQPRILRIKKMLFPAGDP